MKAISVIIPVYNNPAELRLTLDSICMQDFSLGELEVLVCDDGSCLDMKAVAEEYADKFLIRYCWQEDRGFRPGTARNMGIRAAKGSLCVFLDCGVIVTTGCLSEHYSLYQKYGKKLCIIGYILGNDTTSDLEEMREIIDTHTPDEAATIMRKRNMIDGREKHYHGIGDDLSTWIAPYTMLWSLHFAVPTEFMRENYIYFDEYYNSWGCEDNDFGIQLFYHDAKYVLARNACAIHYPAKIRSFDKLHTDPEFRAGWLKNKKYLKEKYRNDRVVQLWLEKGTWIANHPELLNKTTK